MAFPWVLLVCVLTAFNTATLLFFFVPAQLTSVQPPGGLPCPPQTPSTPCPTPTTSVTTTARTRLPTLLVYVYSEAAGSSNTELKTHNLEYFLAHGLCETCSNLEFIFIMNGPVKFDKFPTHANLRVIHREDTCAAGDFAAWDYLFTIIDRKKYKRLMFINDTVRGPFIDPTYARLAGSDFHFTDVFSNLLTNDTKLVGSFINCGGIHGMGPGLGYSHVQTTVWMTDDIGIEVVKPAIRCYGERYEAITHGEIGLSRTMITAGYNIGSMLLAYRGVDFRKDEQARGYCNEQEDPTFTGKYFGQTVHPLEVIFFKNSREGGNWPVIDTYSKFFNEMGKNPV